MAGEWFAVIIAVVVTGLIIIREQRAQREDMKAALSALRDDIQKQNNELRDLIDLNNQI